MIGVIFVSAVYAASTSDSHKCLALGAQRQCLKYAFPNLESMHGACSQKGAPSPQKTVPLFCAEPAPAAYEAERDCFRKFEGLCRKMGTLEENNPSEKSQWTELNESRDIPPTIDARKSLHLVSADHKGMVRRVELA